ncbi:LacI family transcriptional regulator [Falsiroseomonas bella]|uniref:LacI family transcriptional regulator n=1 Tax=Falsiroseomonas bella TaxID=2184016 RepID=A0A317FEB9_9PROT|nr:tripartite tricarboxylate transporter substrate binding protein [Falsiroseomonas bella]PWS36347.1 LacI family transcriptional regulator [Falsiroseomonas bella]
MFRRRHLLAASAALPIARGAAAQSYPDRALRVVVPFGPGGGTDNLMRVIEAPTRAAFGQPLVIENRAGAGGTIGTDLVARAPADGYTVLAVDSSYAINPALFPSLPYDPAKDLVPVSLLASGPVILLAHPSLPVNTVQELVAMAKAQPGALNYASGGNGASTHLAGELLKMVAGIDLVHVPYRGTGPATTDVVAGHVKLMFNGISAARPHVDAGRLKPLAVTGAQRAAALPNVPTFAESGLAAVEASTFWGVLAPAGTPQAAIAKLSSSFRSGVTDPAVQERLRSLGFEPIGGDAAAYAENLRSETTKWAEVVRRANVKLD